MTFRKCYHENWTHEKWNLLRAVNEHNPGCPEKSPIAQGTRRHSAISVTVTHRSEDWEVSTNSTCSSQILLENVFHLGPHEFY